MNTYYLKKIRRRYRYYWDLQDNTIWVLDLKKQETRVFQDWRSFLLDYAYNHRGLMTGFRYQERLLKREKRKQFREHLRHFSPTPNTQTTPNQPL